MTGFEKKKAYRKVEGEFRALLVDKGEEACLFVGSELISQSRRRDERYHRGQQAIEYRE